MEDSQNSFNKKQTELKLLFANCQTAETKYQKLIELGKQLSNLPIELKTPERIVKGCQSIVYLNSFENEGRIYFEADSEALISSGLAYLLITVYSGETAEVILKCRPDFLDELGIAASLTPGRSNGLASIYLRMQQDALKLMMRRS